MIFQGGLCLRGGQRGSLPPTFLNQQQFHSHPTTASPPLPPLARAPQGRHIIPRPQHARLLGGDPHRRAVALPLPLRPDRGSAGTPVHDADVVLLVVASASAASRLSMVRLSLGSSLDDAGGEAEAGGALPLEVVALRHLLRRPRAWMAMATVREPQVATTVRLRRHQGWARVTGLRGMPR
jgi:hypothetical protein